VSIDLSEANNRILLITGANGTGKTSLLSTLHPFATNGTMDVRSDNSLIRKGEEGYKEIHIQDGSHKYVIKHFFSPKGDTHSVKSYIAKDDVELNTNGNVTSFKAIISEELDMEPEYLKLMRLGSNVTNFIDQKSTDRKNYMSKILDDVDLFMKYYKVSTNKIRELKTIISHLSDKLNKLNISNIDEYVLDIETQKEKLTVIETKIKELEQKQAIYNHEVETRDGIGDITSEIAVLQAKLKKVDKDDPEVQSISDCEIAIANLEERQNTLKQEIEVSKSLHENNLNQLSELSLEINECECEIEKAELAFKLHDLSKERDDIDDRIKNIYKIHKDFVDRDAYPYTKSELELLISALLTCNELASTIKSYNHDALVRVTELIESGSDVKSEISKGYYLLSQKRTSQEAYMIINKFIDDIADCQPSCENQSCPLMKFWNKYKSLNTHVDQSDSMGEDYYEDMSIINNTIISINKTLENSIGIINKLPVELQIFLSQKAMFDNLIRNRECVDIKPFNKLLSDISEYEYLQELIKEYDAIEKRISLAKTDSNMDYLERRLSELNCRVDELSSSNRGLLNKIDTNTKSLKICEKDLDNITTLYDIFLNVQEIRECISELREQEEEVSKYQSLLSEVSAHLSNLRITQVNMSREINQADYKINEYNNLIDEFNKYNKKYDKQMLVHRALSTKEGIPLKFIEMYFKKTNMITNDLLYAVYGDSLQLNQFVINSDEFKIPYTVRNMTIPDVAYASQGEKSFISLALSFALASQNLTRYNIMLLDEVDGVLDKSKREMFMPILDTQLDMVDGEQVILISHNFMFDSTPVDVIDMSNNDRNNELPLAHYIKLNIK
jgi:DNA repair exonuclease SbcCD ATPase subunit